MARSFSQDFRGLVIEAAFFGKSARGPAAPYNVGVATTIVWFWRACESVERLARKQGGTKRCKLDAHRDYLFTLIGETPTLTISELLERLAAERNVTISRSTLWEHHWSCHAFVDGSSPLAAPRFPSHSEGPSGIPSANPLEMLPATLA